MQKGGFQAPWEAKGGGLHVVEGPRKGFVKVASEAGLGEGAF